MTPKQVNDIFNKLPSMRRKVLVGFLAGHSRAKIIIDAGVRSDGALTGHFKELYKNFRIDTVWNDADDRRSGERKQRLLISLFVRCKPDLISAQLPDVFDDVEQEKAIAKPQQKSEQPDASSIQERIFQATNQLDPERPMYSRMSAIQVLGEIAKDYSGYQWNIMEILAAFVRNAPRRKEEEGIADDIQAALTVIGQPTPDKHKRSLNLRNTNLRGANLFGADLQGANLFGADLREVCLTTANLKGAVLWEANLEGAKLDIANLEEAKLSKRTKRTTNLQSVNFSCSILRRADLSEAELQQANLSGADLRNADLTGANLERAYLYGANLQEASLMRTKGQRSDLRRAYLQGTKLSGADFDTAKNLKLYQLKLASGDSTTSLPDELKDFKEEILAHWEQSE